MMRTIPILAGIAAIVLAAYWATPQPVLPSTSTKSVGVDANGVLKTPTNFFEVNKGLLNASVTNVGGGGDFSATGGTGTSNVFTNVTLVGPIVATNIAAWLDATNSALIAYAVTQSNAIIAYVVGESNAIMAYITGLSNALSARLISTNTAILTTMTNLLSAKQDTITVNSDQFSLVGGVLAGKNQAQWTNDYHYGSFYIWGTNGTMAAQFTANNGGNFGMFSPTNSKYFFSYSNANDTLALAPNRTVFGTNATNGLTVIGPMGGLGVGTTNPPGAGNITASNNITADNAIAGRTMSGNLKPTNATPSRVLITGPDGLITNTPISSDQLVLSLPVAPPRVTNITVWSEDFSSTLANWQVRNSGTTQATWNIVGGKLRAVSTNTQGCLLAYTNWVTGFHWWTAQFDVTPVSFDAASFGIGAGILSSSDFTDRNAFMWLDLVSSGANSGIIAIQTGTSNNLAGVGGTVSNNLVFAAGDVIHVTMKRRDQLLEMVCSNTVSGGRISYQHAFGMFTNSVVIANPYGIEPVSGWFSFWARGETQDIDNVTFTIDPMYPISTLLVGDSITSGYQCPTYAQTWAYLLRKSLRDESIQIDSNGSDYAGNIARFVPEINLLNPSNIVFMFGGNDIALGISATTWKSNYNWITTNITHSGTIYHCLPTPRDSVDVTPLVTFLSTNFHPSVVIDTFNPIKDGLGTRTLRADSDMGDGTHLPAFPNAAVAEIVENKLRGR